MSFVRPKALDQALDLLHSSSWTILAGGTDYYPSLRGQAPSGPVLDITAIDSLSGISCSDSGIRIGALATWTDVAGADLPPAFNALQQSALEVGSIQIQNRATVIGNLCNASPAADGVPPLLCLDASVELSSLGGVRSVPLTEFIQGNRRTVCGPDELVSALHIPVESAGGHSEFIKLGTRRYLVISIAMVAARVVIHDNKISEIAVAIGACSEVAQRLPLVEQALNGAAVDGDLMPLIKTQHVAGLSPIDDIRSSAGYRRHAALELLRRTIARSVKRASQLQGVSV